MTVSVDDVSSSVLVVVVVVGLVSTTSGVAWRWAIAIDDAGDDDIPIDDDAETG